jgi:photosystem II stability/assembly factor-like uncharacterized protein
MNPTRTSLALALAGALLAGGTLASAGAPEPTTPRIRAAARVAHATQAKLLAGSRAGDRLVVAGDHGVVLLSDDGTSWRQSAMVPVDVQLNALSFVGPREGWAVGHWGVVLHTTDGGETWAVQRQSANEDRPLFGVHFFDAQQGVAVGLWSLVLTTGDGGRTWAPVTLPTPPGAKKADLNLYGLFATPGGELFATSERGMLLRSVDRGQSWSYVATGYPGSFWAGAALADGTVVVGGLRGTIYRNPHGTAGWTRVESGTAASITAIQQGPAGTQLLATAIDGSVLRSTDGGATFTRAAPKANAEGLTGAVLDASGRAVLLTRQGLIR